ncbi:MAG: hypothetical protein H0X24_16130 [Ktedonobacterales bacterium]|nr:hypothetical protein [Ktedonobacterales bacterium]
MDPNNHPINGDESPATPYGQAGDIVPTQPDLPAAPDVAPVATPASARATTNPAGVRAILVGVVAAVVAIALIVAGVAYAKTRSTTPTASEILANAKNAKLTDTTFTLTDHMTANLGGSTTSAFPTTLDITGNGKLTKAPVRNDVTITIPLLGAQNSIEVLTDGSDIYANVGNLAGLLSSIGTTTTGTPTTPPTTSGPPWIKIPVGQPIPTVLDYSHVQNVKLIGAEKVNGKDTWHLQGTLNIAGLSGSATPNPGIAATATAIATQTGASVTPVTEDLWFQQDTYFPAKLTVKFSANLGNLAALMGSTTATPTPATPTPTNSQIASDATVIFTAWNSGITITPPPANQVGDGSSLFPTPTPKK